MTYAIGSTVYVVEEPLFFVSDGMLNPVNTGPAIVESAMADDDGIAWSKVRFARSGIVRWYQADALATEPQIEFAIVLTEAPEPFEDTRFSLFEAAVRFVVWMTIAFMVGVSIYILFR